MRYLAVLLLFTLLIRTDVSISKNHETKTYIKMNFCVTQESYLNMNPGIWPGKRFKKGFMYPIIEGRKCNSVYNFKLLTVKQYGVNYLNQMYSSFLRQYRLDKDIMSSRFCFYKQYDINVYPKMFGAKCGSKTDPSQRVYYTEIFSDEGGYYYKENINVHQNQTAKKPVKEVDKKPVKEVDKKPVKEVAKSSEINSSLITIGSGSGFFINRQGYALTNNHVVSICRQNVSIIDGKEILFRVIGTDKTNDIAIIKANIRPSDYIKINTDGAKLGENVVAVGYPLAGRLSDSVKITKGIVSSLTGLNNNIGQIQIDAALQPGNSGGPVLNEDGVMVGMASAGLNKLLMAKEARYIPENVNFAVASPIIVNVLKNKKIKYSSPSFFGGNYTSTELAEIGSKSTIQLFCRNTREAYAKLKRSKRYSQILLDLE